MTKPHCHHRNESALKRVAVRVIKMFHSLAEAKSQDDVHKLRLLTRTVSWSWFKCESTLPVKWLDAKLNQLMIWTGERISIFALKSIHFELLYLVFPQSLWNLKIEKKKNLPPKKNQQQKNTLTRSKLSLLQSRLELTTVIQWNPRRKTTPLVRLFFFFLKWFLHTATEQNLQPRATPLFKQHLLDFFFGGWGGGGVVSRQWFYGTWKCGYFDVKPHHRIGIPRTVNSTESFAYLHTLDN